MLLALLANGLLRHSGQLYALSNGFHGLASIFLLLAQVGGLNLLGTLSELEVTQYEHKQEQQKGKRHPKAVFTRPLITGMLEQVNNCA